MGYYVICDDDSKHEGLTKEQIFAAIAEATGATPQGVDAAFITQIKEQNGQSSLKFWVGTQAEYNAIENPATNCLYIITDDTTTDDIEKLLDAAKSVNITSDVVLEKGSMLTEGIVNFVSVTPKKFVFSKGQGIVHFAFQVEIEGDIQPGDEIGIYQSGKYRPSPNYGSMHAVVSAYPQSVSVSLHASGAYLDIYELIAKDYVRAGEGGYTTITISGWYFCDGE